MFGLFMHRIHLILEKPWAIIQFVSKRITKIFSAFFGEGEKKTKVRFFSEPIPHPQGQSKTVSWRKLLSSPPSPPRKGKKKYSRYQNTLRSKKFWDIKATHLGISKFSRHLKTLLTFLTPLTHLNKLAKARKTRKSPGTFGFKKFGPGKLRVQKV